MSMHAHKHLLSLALIAAMGLSASAFAQSDVQAEQAAELMKALSHPQRLRVMCMLVDGERTVGEINAEVDLSQSALSQHLALLREGGLVRTRREAQNVYYSVAPGPVPRPAWRSFRSRQRACRTTPRPSVRCDRARVSPSSPRPPGESRASRLPTALPCGAGSCWCSLTTRCSALS